MRPGDRLTLRIEKAVAGGRMLARHDGAIALVAGAIPGELVEAVIEKIQRGTMWAMTERVIEASPDRVEPFCELDCGGTVYAHVRYQRQLGLKREVLRDAFSRLAHVPLPDDVAVAESRPDGYRMRARVHLRNGRLGFFRESTHILCDAGPTRQLLPETLDVLERLERSLAKAAREIVAEIEITENCDASERALNLELTADGDPSALAPLTKVDGVKGASSGAAHHARALTLWGSPEVTDTLHDVRLKRHARAFFQGNRYLLSTLVSRVVDRVPAGTVLDLYAGVGLFSAVLAARGDATLTAVEGDPISAHDLKDNLAPFGARAGGRHQPVELFLSGRVPQQDTVIVDPPRTGMTKQAMEGILRLRAPRIVYVSCDVATLARDVRVMTERRYQLTHVEAFDMFPNTAHVETLAVLERG